MFNPRHNRTNPPFPFPEDSWEPPLMMELPFRHHPHSHRDRFPAREALAGRYRDRDSHHRHGPAIVVPLRRQELYGRHLPPARYNTASGSSGRGRVLEYYDSEEEEREREFEDRVERVERVIPRREHRGSRISGERGNRSEKEQRDGKTVEYKAAKAKLVQNLVKAISHLRELIDGFINEASNVASYAGKDLMNELWRRKIGYSSDSDEEDTIDEVGQSTQTEYAMLVTDCHKLRSLMNKAIHARIEARDDEKRHADSQQRVKINMALGCIESIWPKIHESSSRCKELLVELNQLKTILGQAAPASGSRDYRNDYHGNGTEEWNEPS